jgi:hypothetical protein
MFSICVFSILYVFSIADTEYGRDYSILYMCVLNIICVFSILYVFSIAEICVLHSGEHM